MDSTTLVGKTGYTESNLDVGDNKFSIRVIRFENGAFVSICEGATRLGSTIVSVGASSGTPATTTVIPAKTNSLFLKLAAEMTSSRTGGIAMVSASMVSEISTASSKAILSKIMDMIQ